ncbi:hypothetical protein [Flavobacterium subsaxonicum]|uniref:Uncharacterized protein n=1 Tax=Flavobacterium subsaxonicum WB 4.1-42 = DSM 21790 TaxID=1121898 RepID=A0A0A2MKA0_9FLAO|nr:hypothetical protein [Flavobacterium subsaxonicum]KGO92689.1 hypothetical protein Q766_11245 [Flavobacterium subsaxonicum WB 4.1-42 = DSM 21790]
MHNKLTTQQIQFIDGQLKKAGIYFVDIRCEITDHIASELETLDGDFYDNLSEYLATHKKEITSQNRSYRKIARTKAARFFCKVLFKPVVLLPTLALFFILQYAVATVFTDEMDILKLFWGVVLTWAVVQLLLFGTKMRFSGMEMISKGFVLLYNLHLIILLILDSLTDDTNLTAASYWFALIVSLFPAYTIALYQLKNQVYKNYTTV